MWESSGAKGKSFPERVHQELTISPPIPAWGSRKSRGRGVFCMCVRVVSKRETAREQRGGIGVWLDVVYPTQIQLTSTQQATSSNGSTVSIWQKWFCHTVTTLSVEHVHKGVLTGELRFFYWSSLSVRTGEKRYNFCSINTLHNSKTLKYCTSKRFDQ